MWRGIYHFKETSHHCTCVGSTWHREVIWCVLWCIWHGYWRRINARRPSNCLCFTMAQTPCRALPHPWPRALDCRSCIDSPKALPLRKSSAHLNWSQESEVSVHAAWLKHETMKMARTDQGLWVGSPLSSWKGKCGCKCSKPQAPMQPPHNPTSNFLLWSRRAESLSCSTWKIEQHSSHSNYQGRWHHRSKNRHWNGSYLSKTRVGWSLMLSTRCWWSSMVQGPPSGSKGLQASPQDHGWGSLLQVFYPSRNQQDVSRLEEEFLVDKNEERNYEVCVRMWHRSKSQSWSFETSWKSTTVEHSWVEMEKYLHGFHRGFAPHLVWVQLDMGHCAPLD
jgi:hypothetical protein